LNAVSQILLHKFSKQSEAPHATPLPRAIPAGNVIPENKRARV